MIKELVLNKIKNHNNKSILDTINELNKKYKNINKLIEKDPISLVKSFFEDEKVRLIKYDIIYKVLEKVKQPHIKKLIEMFWNNTKYLSYLARYNKNLDEQDISKLLNNEDKTITCCLIDNKYVDINVLLSNGILNNKSYLILNKLKERAIKNKIYSVVLLVEKKLEEVL